MDMFEGVGRRLDQKTGTLTNIGQNSLNGYERNVLFRNNGDGTFTDVAFVNGADRVEDGRGLSIYDHHRAGLPDVPIRTNRQRPQLPHTQAAGGHWIEVKLVGVRSNRDAVGARLRLHTAAGVETRAVTAGSGYLSGSSLVQHFGLGGATRAEHLEIDWPSGLHMDLHALASSPPYTI